MRWVCAKALAASPLHVESRCSCPEGAKFSAETPGLSYPRTLLSATRPSWEKQATRSSQRATIRPSTAQLSSLSGGAIHHLTMILKGPKFKAAPRHWRPFGACHPAILNERLKRSPFVVSIGPEQNPSISFVPHGCSQAPRRICS